MLLSGKDKIEKNCSDQDLKLAGDRFFGPVYEQYYPKYADLYDGFLDQLYASNLGISGLTFRHFRPNVVKEGRSILKRKKKQPAKIHYIMSLII